jgi:hypothetical protein
MTHEALPRWMAIPMDLKRKDLERLLPLMLLILLPRSSRNWTACGPKDPRVSAPIGMKWKSVRCLYLWIFRCSAFSAFSYIIEKLETANIFHLEKWKKGHLKWKKLPFELLSSICFKFHFQTDYQQTLRIQIQGSQGCQKIRKKREELKTTHCQVNHPPIIE